MSVYDSELSRLEIRIRVDLVEVATQRNVMLTGIETEAALKAAGLTDVELKYAGDRMIARGWASGEIADVEERVTRLLGRLQGRFE